MRSSGNHLTASVASGTSPPTPLVPCDLCELAMPIPAGAIGRDGLIRGLLVCTACVEDALYARALEPDHA